MTGFLRGRFLLPYINVYTTGIPLTIFHNDYYWRYYSCYNIKIFSPTENTLIDDLNILQGCFRKWKLKPNPIKIRWAIIVHNLKFSKIKYKIIRYKPIYEGITLHWSLTFKNPPSSENNSQSALEKQDYVALKFDHLGKSTHKYWVPKFCSWFTPLLNMAPVWTRHMCS